METSFQKIIAAIVGVMILFIIPVYIAFEKVDDVSYSLALKLTQTFVDNVRNKGYISPEMYSDFVSGLYATNNTYDVTIEHVKKRYDPAIYIYERREDGSNGRILHVLDYERYLLDDNKIPTEITLNEGIYNKTNSNVEILSPSITMSDGTEINFTNGGDSVLTPEELYKLKIDQYKELDRIILDKGEIYADVNEAINYDEHIHIPSYIDLYPGKMSVKNPKYEPSDILEYYDYISNYDNSFKVNIAGINYEVFNGPKFISSSIVNTKAAMWIGDKTYNQLDNYEKEYAEEMYYDRLNDYKSTDNQAIIDSRGKVYSYPTSPKYEPLTDYLATSIKVSGTIDIKMPDVWRVNDIEFNDKNILTLRNNEEILVDKGGIFNSIVVNSGTVTKASTDQVFDYTDSLVDNMLNLGDTITIERAEVYTNQNIILSDDASLVVKKITGYTNPDNIEIYGENNPIYTEVVNKWIGSIQEYIDLKDEIAVNQSVTIDGITYSTADYIVTLAEPSKLFCFGQAPSTVELTDNVKVYLDEYKNNGEIVISREYDKDELSVTYESIELYDADGNLKYTFTENESPEEYREYRNEYEANGYITIEELSYGNEDLQVEYSSIIIWYKDEYNQDKQLAITSDDANFSKYLDDYYNDQRIAIIEPEIYKDVNIINPKIEMYSGNKMLYRFERESENPEEVALWEIYSNEAKKGSVTILYKKSDVDVIREKLVIEVLGEEYGVISDTKTIQDNQVNYFDYKAEYQAEGTITFAEANQIAGEDLEVIDPSVTITDPDTGNVIVKYEADFSELTEEQRYQIYNIRVDEWDEFSQIINEKVTYKDGENCNIEMAHVVNEEIITDKQIVSKLFYNTGTSKMEFLRQCMLGNVDMYDSLSYVNENSYIMNEGDQINVTVRNRNQTIASVFYSMFTASVGFEEIPKIYVNYGGTIKNNGETTFDETSGSVTSDAGRIFKYKGQPEELTLEPGQYQIEAWGASGGGYGDAENSASTTGGKGAYVKGIFDIAEETTLYIYVGGQGKEYNEANEENGGYNGGGNSYNGYGGGGASDVRLIKGEWNDETSLLTRIITAGGGGGSSKANGEQYGNGGAGGNLTSGINGTSLSLSLLVGKGASSSELTVGHNKYIKDDGTEESIPEEEKGMFGIGGSVDFDGAGAGGGGYFGGSAAHDEYAGGGGGLSYIYNNNTIYYNTNRFPLSSIVASAYEEDLMASSIRKLIELTSGKWKNIAYVSGEALNGKATNIPDPLKFLGTDTMTGNKGNGMIIIKKIAE